MSQIGAALLARRGTFLSTQSWCTTPWDTYPKSLFDRLLDMISYLASLVEQLDRLKTLQATTARRQDAERVLHSCQALERRFEQWLNLTNQRTPDQPPNYWVDVMGSTLVSTPFNEPYDFRDSVTGTMFIYYWMAQLQFHSCAEGLYELAFEPVIDDFTYMADTLPPTLLAGDYTPQKKRDYANDICRGLDAVLEGTAQPDLLAAPMTVALNLFRDINAESQEGILEILWLENFRARLIEKGRQVATVLQNNSWFELARF